MSIKQLASIVALVVVVGAAAWGLSLLKPAGPAAPQDISHPLPGTLKDGTYTYSDTDGKYYAITATYPAHTSLPAEADLAARSALEQGLASQVDDFKGILSQSLTAEEKARMDQDGGQYAFDAEYKEYTAPKFDSYLYTIYQDTGGAHPNGYFATFVFDQSGKQLSLKDLFVATSTNPKADYLGRIAGIATVSIEQDITKRLGPGSESAFFADGLAPTDDNFSNWVVDGDNLHFFFPPYQVAAYAAGTFDVVIPLAQLSDILKPGVI